MPSVESIVVAHVEAEVADLAGKISPHLRANGTGLPCAIYRAQVDRHPAMNGPSTVQRVEMTLEVVADTLAEARILADQVCEACDHATVSGLQSLHVQGQAAEAPPPDDGQADSERIVSVTLVAWSTQLAEE